MDTYFVSYTQAANDGRHFGFGNVYISSPPLTVDMVKEFKDTIEDMGNIENVVVMFFTKLPNNKGENNVSNWQ